MTRPRNSLPKDGALPNFSVLADSMGMKRRHRIKPLLRPTVWDYAYLAGKVGTLLAGLAALAVFVVAQFH